MSRHYRSALDPLVPAKAGTQRAQVSLARSQPLSSPRRRGPIITKVSGYRWPCHIALLRRMGPRLRGDDRGGALLHIFESERHIGRSH
jgi:hypothetical protein